MIQAKTIRTSVPGVKSVDDNLNELLDMKPLYFITIQIENNLVSKTKIVNDF